MIEFLLLVIAITLIVIACKLPKREEVSADEQVKEPLVAESLPLLIGKTCEFTLKSLSLISASFVCDWSITVGGKVLDIDSEWVVLSSATKKDKTKKIVRIGSIKEVREIKD